MRIFYFYFIKNFLKEFSWKKFQSQEECSSLLKWLSETPKTTTVRVNLLKSTLAQVQDRITDEVLKAYPYSAPRIELIDGLPEVIAIGNLSSSPPPEPSNLKEIIVDVHCGAAILRGAHIFAPGVMAMPTKTQIDEIVDVSADVVGLCKKGTNVHYDGEKVFLGRGRVKMQRHQLYGSDVVPSGVAVEMLETVSGVPSLGDAYLEDVGLLQNLPSIVCGRVLNPQSRERILDMCAAPGNKTTHLAELMRNRGQLIALDKSERRVGLLQKNTSHFDSVQCFVCDATKAVRMTVDEGESPPFDSQSFDRILLDAPCSGIGNRPLLAVHMTAKMQSSYPKIQRKLFTTAVQLLKPGGTLVYSTCTIFPSENERIVAWALEKFHDQIDLVPAEPFFGGPGWSACGLTESQR